MTPRPRHWSDGIETRQRERERESSFLTTHQHIIGYTVSFMLYDLHTMDSRQIKRQIRGYRN